LTISAEAIKTSVFDGNGSTTAFAFTFKTFLAADLVVTLTRGSDSGTSGAEEVETITTDYTVALNSNQDSDPGGTVTMVVAPAAGSPAEKLVISNSPAYTQGVDLVSGGAFSANVVEDAIDRNTILARKAQELTTRSIQIPITDDTGTTVELTTETLRADKALIFDSSGNVTVSTDDYNDQATAAAASAAAAATSATAASNAATAVAQPFLMDTGSTTMGDPAGTNFRLNNATVSSVTLIAFADTNEDGADVSDYLVTWDDSTSTLNGHLILVEEGTPANFAVFTVGAVTDNTDWVQVAVTHVDSGGSLFTNDTTVRCMFVRSGDKGDTGSAGHEMTWETTTTDTDQGISKCWTDNNTILSSTVFYMDDVDNSSSAIGGIVDTWDDSTNRAIRGSIMIYKISDKSNFHLFNVTGAVTSASTYSKVAITPVATVGTISDADPVSVLFIRSGDQGTDAGYTMLWDSDTADADSGTTKVWFDNATLASVTTVYVSDDEIGGTDIQADVNTWDDSGSTINGQIKVTKQDDVAVFALYNVTGSVTSATGYSKVAVTHSVSQGSFTDADRVTMTFFRTGDKGDTGATGAAGSGRFAFDTTADPTANSDASNTDGNGTFDEGSVWVNTSSNTVFQCVDATATAAIWKKYLGSSAITGLILALG